MQYTNDDSVYQIAGATIVVQQPRDWWEGTTQQWITKIQMAWAPRNHIGGLFCFVKGELDFLSCKQVLCDNSPDSKAHTLYNYANYTI